MNRRKQKTTPSEVIAGTLIILGILIATLYTGWVDVQNERDYIRYAQEHLTK
jgi:phosphotransferase system  glucose/maltose/N-acetylglucosamine-specific IIC component